MNEHIRSRKRSSYWAHSCAVYAWCISIWHVCRTGWWEGIPSCAQSPCWPEAIFLNWILCPSPWSIDNLKSHPPTPDQSPCLLPGFRVLSDFLAHHVHIPEVYLIVSTFFLQTPLTELTDGPKVGSGGSQDGVAHLGFWFLCPPRLSSPSSMPPNFHPDPLPSLAVPPPCLLFTYPRLAQPLPALSLPADLCFFISSTFKFFSFWVDKLHDGGGNMGRLDCCRRRRRASFHHLRRNMSLYLRNTPALPLHSSVSLTCPEPSGPQVPFAQMTYITVEWKPPQRSIASGLYLPSLVYSKMIFITFSHCRWQRSPF